MDFRDGSCRIDANDAERTMLTPMKLGHEVVAAEGNWGLLTLRKAACRIRIHYSDLQCNELVSLGFYLILFVHTQLVCVCLVEFNTRIKHIHTCYIILRSYFISDVRGAH